MFEDLNVYQKRNLFIRASDLYHRGSGSPLQDFEFDELKRQLKEEDGDWEVLKMVGVPPLKTSPLTPAKHGVHMGSIDNAMDEQEFTTWYQGIGGGLLCGSYKVDGASLLLTYRDRQLTMAATRGDGETGEDVMHHAIRIKDIPLSISYHANLHVRGEVVMKQPDWDRFLREHPEAKNARNSTSGILGRKDSNDAQYLSFVAHHVWFGEGGEGSPPMDVGHGYNDQMDKCVSMDFVRSVSRPISNTEEARAFFAETRALREQNALPYEIDGVVFIIDDQRKWKNLGIASDNCPRGSIAWKFEAQGSPSELIGIIAETGPTGAITPVGMVKPVVVGGVTVKQASLYNYEEVKRLGISIGDIVMVTRQGDVIPKITKKLGTATYPVTPIIEPTTCPACGGPAGRKKLSSGAMSVVTYCLNDECSSKPGGKIDRWCKSLGIKEMGVEIIDALLQPDAKRDHVGSGLGPLVRTPADLYRLKDTPGYFADLYVNGKKLGMKRADKIIANIEARRRLTVDEILGSIGINNLGVRKVQLIREAARKTYGEQGKFLDTLYYWFSPGFVPAAMGLVQTASSILITYADVLSIPGIAQQLQADIDRASPLINDLLLAGVVVVPPEEVVVAADAPLIGKTFCFTGCRATDGDKKRLKQLGGEEKSSVREGLTYLVVKTLDANSIKAQEAQQLGVQMITYEQFQQIIA